MIFCTKFRVFFLSLLILFSLFILACEEPKVNKPSPDPKQLPITSPPDELDEKLSFISSDDVREDLKKMFRQQNYRLAEKSDFQIPTKAMETEYKGEIEKSTARPYMVNDMNKDGLFADFALIVVNTKKSGNDRFSLVIFNQPKNIVDDYQMIWVYKDQDLSHQILTWLESHLTVIDFDADGRAKKCFITWNNDKQNYSCDEKSFYQLMDEKDKKAEKRAK